jgi:hypothetical protein
MTHKAIVDALDVIMPGNPFSTQMKLDWVNALEGDIWLSLTRPQSQATVTGVAATASYNLPSGIPFHHVLVLTVNGEEYPRIDGTMQDTMGFYDAGSSKFGLYPVPAGAEVIRLSCSVPYTSSTTSTYASVNTIAETPFDDMYLDFVRAKANFLLQQDAAYITIAQVFNVKADKYAQWYSERLPIGRRDTQCGFRLPALSQESKANTRT